MKAIDTLDWDVSEKMELAPEVPDEAACERDLALSVILQAFADIRTYIARVKNYTRTGKGERHIPRAFEQAEDAYLFLIGLSGNREPQWIRAYCRMADIDWQTVLDCAISTTASGAIFTDPKAIAGADINRQGRIKPSKNNARCQRLYKKAAA